MRTKIKEIIQSKTPKKLLKENVIIFGWVKSIRSQKNFSFVAVNDGSCFDNLQIILDNECDAKINDITTGCSIKVEGTIVESPGKNQNLEVKANKISILGKCDRDKYPLQKKRHSFEFLRTIAHLRARTNTQGAVARVRSKIAFATHQFFQERNFLYLQSPIITGSDCEGSGEMFKVTTLDPGEKDSSLDFFQKNAYLTVSGQLEAEIYACSLSDVYTFGPTFRAENSHTSRHLAEFWMIEPEMAFADLNDSINCAEAYIKSIIKTVLEECLDDMKFFNQFIEKGLIEKLEKIIKNDFERISYTEAISILTKAPKKFEYPVKWGQDLQSEHERYLCETTFRKPVVVTDYPKEIKAFYMRQNDDQKTVAAMDILVPNVGELVGGAQREERLDILKAKMQEHNLKEKDYWWYLELREYGSIFHSGFGVGFERLIQFVTGIENIKDVIAFPRYPGHVEF